MLVLAVALMLVAAQERSNAAIGADVLPRQSAYKQCLADRTVEIGAGNSESAETVLRAAAAACRPAETALRALYTEIPLGAAWAERLMARDRKLGEDDGVARLLAARAVQLRSGPAIRE